MRCNWLCWFFLSLALSIVSREFEVIVSSIIMVTLFIEIKTKSGLAVDVEMLVGMVVGGESLVYTRTYAWTIVDKP